MGSWRRRTRPGRRNRQLVERDRPDDRVDHRDRDCDLNAGTAPWQSTGDPGEDGPGDGGVLNVNGHGVNLEDSYQLRGPRLGRPQCPPGLRRRGPGTGLTLLPKSVGPGLRSTGRHNNAAGYEGRTHYGITALSQFENGRLIRKSAGAQSSNRRRGLLAEPTGTAQVDAGVLALPDGAVHAVTVAPDPPRTRRSVRPRGMPASRLTPLGQSRPALCGFLNRARGSQPEVQNMNEFGSPESSKAGARR